MILIGRGLNLGKRKRGAEAKASEEKKLVLRDSRLCSCEGVEKAEAISGSERAEAEKRGHIPRDFR